MALIYGVGIYEKGKYQSKIGQIRTKEYETWMSLLKRCYSERDLSLQPTYRGCTVSDNFKNFQFFAEWCNSQIGFTNKGWCLDKDIILKGNKFYSEDTCCFVPNEINILFTKRAKCRGKCPIGVTFHKRQIKYLSRLMVEGKKVHLGSFSCPIEAFKVYKSAKEEHISCVANKYKDYISHIAYKSLLNYKVDIED